MFTHLRVKLLLLPLLAACGAPGTKPHDMSTAGHEQAARKHEQAATGFEALCTQRPMPAPCWKSRDTWVVKEHRKVAAEHRAASTALRAAEERACVGISEDDRAMSPFEHGEDIVAVEPLVEQAPVNSKLEVPRQVGVIVTFRAVPGLTAEWLQRLVDCHLARNAALGHVVPEMPNCPLVPRGVSARVRSVGNGFAVEVRADDRDTVREVRERAERLIHHDRTASD